MSNAHIEQVEIRTGERSLVIVNLPYPIPSREVADAISAAVKRQLDTWWQSGEQFGVLLVDTGVTVEVKRVE